jgi:hypothetical protein
MTTVNQEFESAPLGRRVVGSMIFTLVITLGMIVVDLVVLFPIVRHRYGMAPAVAPTMRMVTRGDLTPGTIFWMLASPIGVLLIITIKFFYERAKTARFRIEDNELVLGSKHYPLAGMTDIAPDPEILRWAIRTRGNGGIGSIRGHFRSRRVGKFEAFLTDNAKAVVLRWPDRTVAVSPADTEFFIHSARTAAGQR